MSRNEKEIIKKKQGELAPSPNALQWTSATRGSEAIESPPMAAGVIEMSPVDRCRSSEMEDKSASSRPSMASRRRRRRTGLNRSFIESNRVQLVPKTKREKDEKRNAEPKKDNSVKLGKTR